MLPASLGLLIAHDIAASEARHGSHQFIEPEHSFIGICKVGTLGEQIDWQRTQMPDQVRASFQSEIKAISGLFAAFPVDLVDLYRAVRKRLPPGTFHHTESVVHRSQRVRQAFDRALAIALDAQAGVVDVRHLLSALLEDPGPIITSLLADQKVDPAQLRQQTARVTVLPFALSPDDDIRIVPIDQPPAPPQSPGQPDDRSLGAPRFRPRQHKEAPAIPFLQEFGKDLTQLARDGQIQPPVGRKREMLEVVRVLSMAGKNCPVLVGEAGVGKTAVVEGLACRIAQGKAPPVVQDKRIIQLDLTTLLAGTRYRGDFEERIKNVLAEAAASPDVILFIDEIHTVMGAGGTGGPLDAANILKPALGRGEVRLIGATTHDEYRKHIAKDPALERRFEPVEVAEPTAEEALAVLRGVRDRLQQHHQITIHDDALAAAVTLAVKYLPDRRLPAKAIDLLERACATVAVRWTSALPGEEAPSAEGVLTAAEVARVVADQTGIPVARLTEAERDRLLRMAGELKQRVIGQDPACEAVAQVVQRSRLGLAVEGRPIGVLLFVGPTGVGKTELARATAAWVFGSDRAMIRLDMSEFMEKHAIARLIGAPPGYVGHDEEGQLTGALHRNPHSLVLLDEIEKAHPDALNLFLQLFDAGRLTDAKGRTIDATNALFILTSNLSVTSALQLVPVVPTEAQARSALLQHLRPELVNRIDRVIVFRTLAAEDFRGIAVRGLKELSAQLAKQHVGLRWDEAVPALLAGAGQSETFGARELLRVIDQHIRDVIAARLAKGEIKPGQALDLSVEDGRLTFSW